MGIWSYDGQEHADGNCTFMQASGAFAIGLDADECDHAGLLPLLCREIHTTKILQTLTITSTTTTTATATSTLIAKKNDWKMNKIGRALRQEDYTVCEHSFDGIHLAYGPYMYTEAATACQTYGWYPAHLNFITLQLLKQIWHECQPFDATGWINAIDDITTTGVCRFVYHQGIDELWLVVSEGEDACFFGLSMVVCMEDDFFPHTTSSGGDILHSASTVYQNTTSRTLTITATTTTFTTSSQNIITTVVSILTSILGGLGGLRL